VFRLASGEAVELPAELNATASTTAVNNPTATGEHLRSLPQKSPVITIPFRAKARKEGVRISV
jgi:hypothetical protein